MKKSYFIVFSSSENTVTVHSTIIMQEAISKFFNLDANKDYKVVLPMLLLSPLAAALALAFKASFAKYVFTGGPGN